MNLLKRNIHMNRTTKLVSMQLTLDDDFIVPDIKADVDRIIAKTSDTRIDNVVVNNGRITVRGALDFKVLYGCAEENSVDNMKGSIVYEEQVNCDGVDEFSDIESGITDGGLRVDCTIENIHIGIINTRKISVKAILQLTVTRDEIYDIETAVNVEGNEKISTLTNNKKIAQIAVSKKDILRIKDEIDIANNKPNIGSVIWESVRVNEVNTRPMNGAIGVTGELHVFVIYRPVEEDLPFQWMEGNIPFSGSVVADNCYEDMIPNIKTTLTNVVIDVRNDYDGEPRIIAVDGVLELNIVMYQEEEITYLADVYCCGKELEPEYREVTFNNVLIKNATKAKILGKLNGENAGLNILQVCNCEGTVSVTGTELAENGIRVLGNVNASMLYISDDDRFPFAGAVGKIPFEHVIEVPGLNRNVKYFITTGPLSLSANMTGAAEVEIKGNVMLECLALGENDERIMVDIREYPLDMDKILAMPGMVGHMVKSGDTLWNIAKKYYTTVDSIKNINGLKNDIIHPGDMLLIVKNIEGC